MMKSYVKMFIIVEEYGNQMNQQMTIFAFHYFHICRYKNYEKVNKRVNDRLTTPLGPWSLSSAVALKTSVPPFEFSKTFKSSIFGIAKSGVLSLTSSSFIITDVYPLSFTFSSPKNRTHYYLHREIIIKTQNFSKSGNFTS